MKKLVLALAVVAAAVASQAASYDWKTAKSGGAVVAGDGITLAASTAYLFTADSAASILSAFAAGNDWTIGALDSSAFAETGKITAKSTLFDYSGDISAIFVVEQTVGGEKYLYISTVASATDPGVGSNSIQFKESAVGTAINDKSAGYVGAGWYGAVPEPTSGLLLLLGVAGLALKRKRA